MSVVAYVANAASGDISVLALDPASGTLDEVQRFPVGGSVMPLAVSPDRRVLHASIRTEPYRVLGLAIDPRDGRLAELGSAPLPASMCWISTDRSGRWLLAASYGGSLVSVSPIGADGVARAATQVLPTAAHAHSIQVDPSNRFAFAASLGGDLVHQYRFDAATGLLADNDPPLWHATPKSGPRHFAFHPTLPRVYLLGELDAGIDVLAFDRERGLLASTGGARASALPPGFDAAAQGAPWAADLHVTPDGRFLYASERRSHTLAAFAIEPSTGALTPIGSVPTETQPRGFALTPDGRFLLAAGQVSHRLSRHAVDAADGRLTKLGDQAVGEDPNWIEVVALPG